MEKANVSSDFFRCWKSKVEIFLREEKIYPRQKKCGTKAQNGTINVKIFY